MNEAWLQLTDQERNEWIADIANSASGEERALEEIEGFEITDVEEIMLDNGYERCASCDWYKELYELRRVDGDAVCFNCDEESEED